MVTITTIITTKRVYPLSPNFFNNQYLLLNHQVNIPLSRNFFLNSYFISQAKNIKAKFKREVGLDSYLTVLAIKPLRLGYLLYLNCEKVNTVFICFNFSFLFK